MASTWGKVLDQASIILSRQDLEKACIKATRHDNMIPKEKHVRRLIVCTHERSDLTDKIYVHLVERLEIPDWIVVLKTLEVFHRLFRDGNPRFLADLKWKGSVFNMSRFNDPTNGEAHAQSVFIRKYAQYLEEKVMVFRSLRMEFDRDPTLLKNLSVEDSFVRLPKLQRQLDALIHCQTSAEAITNPITALAFEMLLKDSFKLYRGLNDGIITLLESYFTLEKRVAITALEIYRGFMRETSSIIAMYEMAKKKFTLEVPDLKHAPTTLINSLEDYIREGDEADYHSQHTGDRRSQSPVPKQQSAASLFDTSFNEHPPARQAAVAPSLIDPFGVSDFAQPTSPQVKQPQQPQQALFDPFGDSFPPTQQPQFSSPQQNGFSEDPFGSTAFPANFPQQPQQGYDQKAQQIKASYTPTLQPTSPNMQPNNTTSPSFPKPNYNINLNGSQPIANQPNNQLVPSGQFNPFGGSTSPQPPFQQQQSFQQQPSQSTYQQQSFHSSPYQQQQQQQTNPFF